MAAKVFPQFSGMKDVEVTFKACQVVLLPKAGAHGEDGTKLVSFSEKVFSSSGYCPPLCSPYTAFVKV